MCAEARDLISDPSLSTSTFEGDVQTDPQTRARLAETP